MKKIIIIILTTLVLLLNGYYWKQQIQSVDVSTTQEQSVVINDEVDYYTKDELNTLFDATNERYNILLDRLDALEELDNYTIEEIYLIIEMHELEVKIHEIQDLAELEERELTTEEELAIALYEMLLEQAQDELGE